MLYHPALIILSAIILLVLSYKRDRIFNIIAFTYPVIGFIYLYDLSGKYSIDLSFIALKIDYSENCVLIGYAFMISLLASNLFAISVHKKDEVILGSLYGAFAFITIFADDLILLIVGIELMMIASSIIIFIGEYRQSMRVAKKYFLTHLMSGTMIIIAIAYLVIKQNSSDISNIVELINKEGYNSVIFMIMLSGIAINMAAFPFSGWMVNYYPLASSAGFPYLITFTTKVSVVILLKLFSGYEPLKYIAIVMIIYSSIKAIFENNILSILCLLSIMQMGFMMIGVSYGTEMMNNCVIIYLFLHILYKTLLSISAVTIVEYGKVTNCTELKRIKNHFLLAGIIIGIIAMINVPFTATFLTKSYVTHNLNDNVMYYLITFLGSMTVIAIPWNRYSKAKETMELHLGFYGKASIVVASLAVIIYIIAGCFIPILPFVFETSKFSFMSFDTLKQFFVIFISIAVSIIVKKSRVYSKSLNLLETFGDVLFYFYAYLDKKEKEAENRERWSFVSLERQFLSKLESIHNQQTAIYIAFTIFIIMLISFMIKGLLAR